MRAKILMGLLGLLLAAGCTASSSTPAAKDVGYDVALETQPTPMQSGRVATVTIRVKDAGGQAVNGATVTFKGQHKGMAMGGGVGPVTAQEREPGVYSGGMTPTMGGTYALTVTVDGPKGKGERTIDAEAQ